MHRKTLLKERLVFIMQRLPRIILVLAIVFITILVGGFLFYSKTQSMNAMAQGMGGEMPPMPVPVITVSEKPVQVWKNFSGRLMAVDYVELRPQVSGVIEKIHFEDGQMVKVGDALFSIDPKPYQAAVSQAQAQVMGAKEDFALAEKEMVRAQELLKSGAISRQGFDERTNAQKTNKSSLNVAYANLKAAQIDLDRATIKSPISGRISRAEITVGNLVKAENAPLLATIVSDKEIYGDFDVDEQTYLDFVRGKTGADVESEQSIPVKLTLNNDTKEYQGRVKSFDNKINPSSGTIRARAIFANDDNALLPGMFANILIGSSGKEQKITIPEKSVLTDQSRKFVYVVDKGMATYREVTLGATTNGERIVLSGLNVGDQVIIDGFMKLRPGAPVQGMSQKELDAMKAQMAAGPQGAPQGEPSQEKPAEGTPPQEKAKE